MMKEREDDWEFEMEGEVIERVEVTEAEVDEEVVVVAERDEVDVNEVVGVIDVVGVVVMDCEEVADVEGVMEGVVEVVEVGVID